MKELEEKINLFYSKDNDVIKHYSNLFNDLKNKNLIDSSFLSQFTNKDKSIQRLSELVITKYCLSSFGTLNPSKDDGPDITVSYKNNKVNIELVTPLKVQQKEMKVAVFSNELIGSSMLSRRTSRPQLVPDTDSLHPRITSVYTDKLDAYQKYLKNGVVSKNDINIVCINLGYIENYNYIDFNYLRNLFHRQEIIQIELDEKNNASHDVFDNTFTLKKHNNTSFETSYLDNDASSEIIDGIWIIAANEKTYQNLSHEKYDTHEKAKNIIYTNNNSKQMDDLVNELHVSRYQTDYFTNYIRTHKALPNT
ncbi:hypothetical protein [Providencia rettgeri]|uniref:hypothetical protein n=1 Tax=Providencia rettgeri TaxID=587 RepID=UPI00065E17AE|nr:hypothetical protein [Providencia rettgeri]